MSAYQFEVDIKFKHQIHFTTNAFSCDNPTLEHIFISGGYEHKLLVFIEQCLLELNPQLGERIASYIKSKLPHVTFAGIVPLQGGESIKKDFSCVQAILDHIESAGIDRHSWVLAIGGGALLDAVGFAGSIAHRGVRLVRMPTTSLAQDDSGVGVKNAINAYDKKNFIGCFSVPYAVVNDFDFLATQAPQECREGLVEAVKVACVKDEKFFNWIEQNSAGLFQLQAQPLQYCIEHSALLHARHICEGGDPFEMGSSRPLDFGHWVAHRLEQMSASELSHARAVSIGLAVDVLYSTEVGLLSEVQSTRILKVLAALDLPLWHDLLQQKSPEGQLLIWQGLEEFREHLGGRLTILLLKDIGRGVNIHHIDYQRFVASLDKLAQFASTTAAEQK